MTEKEIYAECLRLGMTPAGAAGATANILAESAGRPNNVEDRSGIPDEQYTRGVDNGTYANFVNDHYGYGLAQWTNPSRKAALLSRAQNLGKSIGDAQMQLNFLADEMRKSYAYVWSILTTTSDPYTAGYEMCKRFEIPANTEQTAKARGEKAEEIYKQCAGTEPAEGGDEPSTEFWPPRMICLGMEGADVSVLQALLAARGSYTYAISGIFDGNTKEATLKFQGDHALAKDAIVGPLTWGELLKK